MYFSYAAMEEFTGAFFDLADPVCCAVACVLDSSTRLTKRENADDPEFVMLIIYLGVRGLAIIVWLIPLQELAWFFSFLVLPFNNAAIVIEIYFHFLVSLQ
jgi:hypothetical protein